MEVTLRDGMIKMPSTSPLISHRHLPSEQLLCCSEAQTGPTERPRGGVLAVGPAEVPAARRQKAPDLSEDASRRFRPHTLDLPSTGSSSQLEPQASENRDKFPLWPVLMLRNRER